jgi:hypothetical protein
VDTAVVLDFFEFVRAFVANPRQVSAVAPSGRTLARLMTQEIVPGAGPVIELGPGTSPNSARGTRRRVSRASTIRAVIAQLWAVEHDAATAPIVAEQLVHLSLGDAYQELVLGIGSPGPEVFERQIDAALALGTDVPSPSATGEDRSSSLVRKGKRGRRRLSLRNAPDAPPQEAAMRNPTVSGLQGVVSATRPFP